ncbi:MAG: hypothetical protein KJ880_08650 [Candidatus Omnitrophica bacterium]|nr:hypothetical protein [Candidatus Omnitrophota bacterium]MBU1869295.1 hypothetical protein [Candidatus Omnitrophota bacterium]
MKKFAALILAGFILSGCIYCQGYAGNQSFSGPKPISSRELADNLLAKMFSSYQNYFRGNFSRIVSDDFMPDKFSFINSVESSFYSGQIIEINYFINQVSMTQDEKLSVSFNWEKKTIPNKSGVTTLTRGTAEFVFQDIKDRWRLIQAKGNSPF